MSLKLDRIFEPSFLKDLLLALAGTDQLEELAEFLVETLAGRDKISSAQLWLRNRSPNDDAEGPEPEDRLDLFACAGAIRSSDSRSLSPIPLGAPWLGEVAQGTPLRIEEIGDHSRNPLPGMADSDVGFGAAPLSFQGEIFGVLAVLTEVPLRMHTFEWLQIITDHSAAAIARAYLRRESDQTIELLQAEIKTVRGQSQLEDSGSHRVFSEEEMKQRERDNLMTALDKSNWKIYGPEGAAALLGMKPTTLASRMKKLSLRRPPQLTLVR